MSELENGTRRDRLLNETAAVSAALRSQCLKLRSNADDDDTAIVSVWDLTRLLEAAAEVCEAAAPSPNYPGRFYVTERDDGGVLEVFDSFLEFPPLAVHGSWGSGKATRAHLRRLCDLMNRSAA